MKLVLSGIEVFFEHKPIDTLIEVADFLNINYLDIWVPRNTSISSEEEIKKKLKKSGKQVVCVTTWSHLCNDQNNEEDDLLIRSSLYWAKLLGSPRINTYFGFLGDKDDKLAIDIYFKKLEPILKEAERDGIIICIENEFDSRGHDPHGSDVTRSADRFMQLVTRINSPNVKITFDASNFYIAQEEYYPYAIELLKEYIDYIHLKDTRKYRKNIDLDKKKWIDHGREYIFCPLGEGVINWERLLASCKSYNKDWFYALEPHTIYEIDDKTTLQYTSHEEQKMIKLMGKKVMQDYITSVNYIRSLGIQ